MSGKNNNERKIDRRGRKKVRGAARTGRSGGGLASAGGGERSGGNRGGLTSSTRLNSLTQQVEPWMPLFPARCTKTLRYSTSLTITSTSGVPSGHVFRANDLFDPDFTSTGHQPMGFDQMMLSYNHFCVTHAKIKVVFRNLSSSVYNVGIRLDANSTVITTPDQFIEFGGMVLDDCESKSVYGANKVLNLSLDVAKIQGVSMSAMTADPSLRGSAAASPTEVSYFHLMAWDTTGNTGSVFCDVVLEQTAVFLEPRDLTVSLRDRVLHSQGVKHTALWSEPAPVVPPLPEENNTDLKKFAAPISSKFWWYLNT